MTKAELLGLRYSDIDFDKKEVTIQYTWAETEGKEPILKTCKTESSYRKMIVSDYTISLLKRQKSIYLRNAKKAWLEAALEEGIEIHEPVSLGGV